MEGADCVPAPAGLVSWWPGDSNATDRASSHNGTLQNGAFINPEGLVSGAFSFDGINDFVQIADAPALRPTNLTIETWVRFSSLDSTGNAGVGQQYLVFKQNTRRYNFEGFYLGKERRPGGDNFAFRVSSSSGRSVRVTSASLIATGVWYHVAGVRGPNFIQLYVNGQLTGQAAVNFAQNYGNYPLYLGSSGQAYWDRKLAGQLDEVSLYHRALAASEIAAIYAAGRAGKCKAPPPAVTLLEPTNNAAFVVAAGITLEAAAASPNGAITNVEFFDGTNKLGEVRASPFLFSWQIPTPGSHLLSARATDSLGLSATSSPVSLTATDADSDYDGRSNLQEVADHTDPFNAASVRPVLLGSWSFDDTNLSGDQGQMPTYQTGVQRVPGWNSHAVEMPFQALYSGLIYRDVETNFQANINCRHGTVRFWFKPNWNSTANGVMGGPRTHARLLELGGYELADGWWALHLDPEGTALSFSTMSNLNYTFNLSAPIRWVSNQWYQITLTFSPHLTVLYLNGELAATGFGIQSFPGATLRAHGFRLGFDWYGGQSPAGQFEELETFNYPLDAATVARDFPNHQLASGAVDSDYDGRSDFLETQVDETNPNDPGDVISLRLGYWRFDAPDWRGEQGQMPLATNNVVSVPGWSGRAMAVAATGPGLVYREVETNGWANVNCRNGTVRFWFKPHWNSGSGSTGGSGTEARLLEMGSADSVEGWWGLTLNPEGTRLRFHTMTNLVYTTNCSAPILWDSNHWYQVTLTYSSDSSALYLNGVLAGSGSGVQAFPSARLRANGLAVGGQAGSGQSPNGQFEELETFNYVLPASQIAAPAGDLQRSDADLNGIPDRLEELSLSQSRPFSATPFVVAGAIEAEQFDEGGPTVGYFSQVDHGTTDYRATRLAIEACSDRGGGYCVNQLQAGDWMQYTFETRQSGRYTFEVRAAADSPGGQIRLEFARANGTANYQTPAQVLAQAGWQSLRFPDIHLEAQTNIFRVLMATNSPDGSVGRLNYIAVYPTIPAFVAPANALFLDVTAFGALGDGNPNHASVNRQAFQQALNTLMDSPGGGTLFVPAGTYFLDKNPANHPGEDPGKGVRNNCALEIGRGFGDMRPASNIAIRGDTQGESILQALDRSTTLLYVRRLCCIDPGIWYTNFSFTRLTFRGRPHIRPDGTYDPGAFHNYNQNSAYALGLGSLLVLGSDEPAAPIASVNIHRCQFLNPAVDGVILSSVRDVAFSGNSFRFWDGEPLPVASTNAYSSITGTPVGGVGIFGNGAPAINVVVLSNAFNGNPGLANLSDTNYSADGLLWLQSGGNWFAAHNAVTNYGLEAIQYNAGPGTAVGNQFVTTQRSGSTAALVAFASGWPSLSSSGIGPVDQDGFYTFTGNEVEGGREGFLGLHAWQQYGEPLYNVSFCGNDLTLQPPVIGGAFGDWPGCAVWLGNCRRALVAGNRLRAGGYGYRASFVQVEAELLKNDFAGADHLSILYEGVPGNLQSVSLVKNRLSSGQPFPIIPSVVSGGAGVHVKLPYPDSSRFFLIQNVFLDVFGNSTGVLLDPPSAPVCLLP